MAHGIWSSTGGSSGGGGWGAVIALGAAAAASLVLWHYVLQPLCNVIGPVGLGAIGAVVVGAIVHRVVGTKWSIVILGVIVLVGVGVVAGAGVVVALVLFGAALEAAAAVSFVLDHLEADVDVTSRGGAWAASHLTMIRRTGRRLRRWWKVGAAFRRHATRTLRVAYSPADLEVTSTPATAIEPLLAPEPEDAPSDRPAIVVPFKRRNGAA